MKIKILSLVLLTLVVNSSVFANQTLNLKILSPGECVFGDMDLIFMDFQKDASFSYTSSKLIIEIIDEKSKELIRRDVLVDLVTPERKDDKFAKVFEPSGLDIVLADLPDSNYSISLCKIGASKIDTCQKLEPKEFNVLFAEHTADGTVDNKQYDKLYYFKQFRYLNGAVDSKELTPNPLELVNSMPLEIKGKTVNIRLPRNDAAKCSLPEA